MGRRHRPESNTEAINARAGKYRTKAPRPPSRKRTPSVRPVPPQARAGSGDGGSMAARSFVACAATWRAVSPPSAARCAMSDSLSRRQPFPHFRHPTATPPARPSDAQQQSRPAPDTGHGPWSSRPTRRQPARPCRAASRSGQCVTPHPRRPRSVGRSDAFSGRHESGACRQRQSPCPCPLPAHLAVAIRKKCQGRNKIRPGGGGKLDHLAAGPCL